MTKHDEDKMFCVSVVSHMRALLAKRDFVGAVECYEASRGQIDTEAGTPDAGEVLHLVAQAFASLTKQEITLEMVGQGECVWI